MRRTLLTLIASGLITATTPSCISSQASRGTAIAVGVGATLLGAAVYGAASDTDRCTDECRPDVGGILLGVGLMALGGGTAALNGLMYLSDPPARDKAAPAKATATASLGDTNGGLQVLPPSAFVLDERWPRDGTRRRDLRDRRRRRAPRGRWASRGGADGR